MAIHYSGTVTVRLTDDTHLRDLGEAVVHVEFEADGDPRELLTRIALDQAAANAATAERFL